MSDHFSITPEWLLPFDDDEDPEEAASAASVSVSAGTAGGLAVINDPTSETTSGARLPTILLAEGLVRRWWQMLYEPPRVQEREPRRGFEPRHRLDSLTPGYVFPPIGIWSGGETVMIGMFKPDTRFQTQTFILPPLRSISLQRAVVEDALGAFIHETIERIKPTGARRYRDLSEDWDRIINANLNPELREWCTNAGRLGLDPYDADMIDFGRISAGISENLFADVCEAADINTLASTAEAVRSALRQTKISQPISVSGYAAPPYRDLSKPGWRNGHEAANLLRSRLSLPVDPRQAAQKLFTDAENDSGLRFTEPAVGGSVEGVVSRSGNEVRAIFPARSIKQRRFRQYRAAYLGWRAGRDTDAAMTFAETWRQQASRAFAAEMLAPQQLLKTRYGQTGLDARAIERLSSEWLCPPRTIVHQADNLRIPVKGGETAAFF